MAPPETEIECPSANGKPDADPTAFDDASGLVTDTGSIVHELTVQSSTSIVILLGFICPD